MSPVTEVSFTSGIEYGNCNVRLVCLVFYMQSYHGRATFVSTIERVVNFIHFWSVTLVNTIKTTSFTPPSVIKLYLYVCIRLYMFRFLANHLQKAYQHCKETTIT
jgi:hypothetical protein